MFVLLELFAFAKLNSTMASVLVNTSSRKQRVDLLIKLVMCWPVNNALCGFGCPVAALTVVLTCMQAFITELQLALNHGLTAWPVSAL